MIFVLVTMCFPGGGYKVVKTVGVGPPSPTDGATMSLMQMLVGSLLKVTMYRTDYRYWLVSIFPVNCFRVIVVALVYFICAFYKLFCCHPKLCREPFIGTLGTALLSAKMSIGSFDKISMFRTCNAKFDI